MEKKNIRETRSRKGKTDQKIVCAETLQECCSTDKNVREDKMAAENVGAKKETKKVFSGRRGGKKSKVKIVIQSEADPSDMGMSHNTTVVEKTDFMVVCKYKLPPKFDLKPTKPYEVRWGHNFLKTLLTNPKKSSILKKSSLGGKGKSHLRFTQTTVYYFERAQPHSTIPIEGDIAVNMEQHHFYSNHLPVDAFEAQKEVRQKRNLAAMNQNDNNNEDIHKLVLPANSKERDIILHAIQVPVELMDEDKNKKNIVQKVKKPCSCNLYCDPDICECNLTGTKCEVFKDNFPCGCQLEYCKNPNGREAFNNRYIKKNIVAVANSDNIVPETKEIKCSRVNKRKQVAPLRYRKY